MYAAIQMLFGLQQAAEGIVWTSMGKDSSLWLGLQGIGVMLFLGFALVVWPTWVPWSVLNIETDEKKRLVLKIMGLVGLCVSATTMWFLYTAQPVPHIVGQCMAYSLNGISRNVPPNLDAVLYLVTVPFPFFISTDRKVKMTGALITVGLILSHIINKEASTSIWCFFAAIASGHIVWHFLSQRSMERSVKEII